MYLSMFVWLFLILFIVYLLIVTPPPKKKKNHPPIFYICILLSVNYSSRYHLISCLMSVTTFDTIWFLLFCLLRLSTPSDFYCFPFLHVVPWSELNHQKLHLYYDPSDQNTLMCNMICYVVYTSILPFILFIWGVKKAYHFLYCIT